MIESHEYLWTHIPRMNIKWLAYLSVWSCSLLYDQTDSPTALWDESLKCESMKTHLRDKLLLCDSPERQAPPLPCQTSCTGPLPPGRSGPVDSSSPPSSRSDTPPGPYSWYISVTGITGKKPAKNTCFLMLSVICYIIALRHSFSAILLVHICNTTQRSRKQAKIQVCVCLYVLCKFFFSL